MLRRVALVRSDVSLRLSSSIIRVRRIGELVITLVVTSNRRMLLRNMKEYKLWLICYEYVCRQISGKQLLKTDLWYLMNGSYQICCKY
jgi:hypothetical protein